MMLLQTKPNGWSCLPTAFAIVLGIDTTEIFEYLDHDGSVIEWPDLDEPKRRRGFHVQELINFCLMMNYSVTCVTPNLGLCPQGSADIRVVPNSAFQHYYDYYNGVITGFTDRGNGHALALYGGQLFDPDIGDEFHGTISFDRFHIIQKVM